MSVLIVGNYASGAAYLIGVNYAASFLCAARCIFCVRDNSQAYNFHRRASVCVRSCGACHFLVLPNLGKSVYRAHEAAALLSEFSAKLWCGQLVAAGKTTQTINILWDLMRASLAYLFREIGSRHF